MSGGLLYGAETGVGGGALDSSCWGRGTFDGTGAGLAIGWGAGGGSQGKEPTLRAVSRFCHVYSKGQQGVRWHWKRMKMEDDGLLSKSSKACFFSGQNTETTQARLVLV